MTVTSNVAVETVLRASLERSLAGKAVGFSFQMRRQGEIIADIHEGWARAPWETAYPSVPMSAGQRHHIASMSKSITLAAMACVLEDWARVIADPGFRVTWLPALGPSADECVNIAKHVSAIPNRRFVTPAFVSKVSRCGVSIDFSTPFAKLLTDPFSNVITRLLTLGNGVSDVTIDQLILHQSGLDTSNLSFAEEATDVFFPTFFLRALLQRPIDHSKDGYNNWNYTLLRLLVEGLSGVSFSEYVHKRVLLPSGARRVSLDLTDDSPEARSLAYSANFAGLTADSDFAGLAPGNEPHHAYYSNGGAGGFWASVDDLNAWLQDLLSPRSNVFPPGTDGASNPWRDAVVARFMGGPLNGQNPPVAPWFSFQCKNGGGLGFNSCMGIAPNERISAVLLVNNEDVVADRVFADALKAIAPVITLPAPWNPDKHVKIINPLSVGKLSYRTGPISSSGPWSDYVGPFLVSLDVDIQAAVFDGTQMISSIAAKTAHFAGAMMQKVTAPARPNKGAAYRLVQNAADVQRLGDAIPAVLEALVAKGSRTGVLADIDLSFLPMGTQNCVVVYGAWLTAASDQFYDFTIQSDDGSLVWIDGHLVLDNDGLHDSRKKISATVGLKQGEHRVLCAYFQGGGDAVLTLCWRPQGGAFAALGPSLTTD